MRLMLFGGHPPRCRGRASCFRWGLPECASPRNSVSSYLTISTLPADRRYVSVALSFELPRQEVILHLALVKPGLSSPVKERPSSVLRDAQYSHCFCFKQGRLPEVRGLELSKYGAGSEPSHSRYFWHFPARAQMIALQPRVAIPPPFRSADDVVAGLAELDRRFQAERDPRGLFVMAYVATTGTITQWIARGAFLDNQAMARYVVAFGNAYRRASCEFRRGRLWERSGRMAAIVRDMPGA